MKIGHYLNIGEPIEVQNRSIRIYPLFYQGTHTREYKLLEEVQSLVSMKDSGKIDTVYIRNNSKFPVFIRAGNILKGSTQNRAIKRSIIVFPIDETRDYRDIEYIKSAEVYCVHQTSPINTSGTFGVNCLVPHQMESAFYLSAPQSKVWNDAYSYSSACNNYSDDVCTVTSKVIETYSDEVEKLLKTNPEILDAVGIVVVDAGGILAIELYDSQVSWNVMSRKILNKYSSQFAIRSIDYTTGNFWKNIPTKIQNILNSNFRVLAKFSDRAILNGKDWMSVTYQGNLEDRYEAEITRLNKKVIHLAVVRGTKFVSGTEEGPINIEF